VECMNANAVAYTNKIRRSAGLKPLGMGTSAMLKNALGHSREMAGKGDIYHQPIGKGVYVGSGDCKGMLTGENVAMNFIQDDSADAAALCVEQWRKSPGHYRNIVNQDNINVRESASFVSQKSEGAAGRRKGTGCCTHLILKAINKRNNFEENLG